MSNKIQKICHVSLLFIFVFLLTSLLSSFLISELRKSLKIQECSQKELYLIIQSIPKATLEKNRLIIHDVPPYATAFTQRPIRKVELIPLYKLLRLWDKDLKDGFAKNPPNAAINAFIEGSGSEEHLNFFVQLLEPVYDAQKRTLTYGIKPMDGNPTAIPESAMLGHVNLFIDDICLNCWWPNGR